jgi:transmembrane sensor
MHQKEFRKVLKKYKKGICTPEEQALVEQWFTSMGSFGNPSLDASEKSEIKERSWTRVQKHMAYSTHREAKQHRPLWRMNPGTAWAVAAAFLLLMVSALFLIVRSRSDASGIPALAAAQKVIVNTSDEVTEVFLKDGSRVFLEPHSKLSFSETFEGSQRLVALEGEAFFAVSRDSVRPFVVTTNEVITKVLGTTFSVSAFPNEDNVTIEVITGKVSVMTRKEKDNLELQETILTPNQKAIYNKSKKLVSRSIVDEPIPIVPAEVVKRMHFEAAPIGEIFRALEDVYGVEIKFDADVFSACILTTSIAGGNIYNRLDMICKAIDAEYVLEENRIVITGAGCHK